MAIYKSVLASVLFLYGLWAWGDNLSAKDDTIIRSTSTSSVGALKSVSHSSAKSYTATIDNPEKGESTPIAITINLPPTTPAPSEPIKMPELPPISETKSTHSTDNKIEIPPSPSLDIVINKKYRNSPKVKKLYKMLGLSTSSGVIHLVTNRNLASKRENIVAIQSRSFLSMLDYLSNGVEVAPEMIKQGLVVVPKYPNGEYYDVNNMTKGLFSVHISPTLPRDNVSVRVYYRNYWFYIADNDHRSKRTFSMLQQIFNLQAGETPGQNIPVLTIPTR